MCSNGSEGKGWPRRTSSIGSWLCLLGSSHPAWQAGIYPASSEECGWLEWKASDATSCHCHWLLDDQHPQAIQPGWPYLNFPSSCKKTSHSPSLLTSPTLTTHRRAPNSYPTTPSLTKCCTTYRPLSHKSLCMKTTQGTGNRLLHAPQNVVG